MLSTCQTGFMYKLEKSIKNKAYLTFLNNTNFWHYYTAESDINLKLMHQNDLVSLAFHLRNFIMY